MNRIKPSLLTRGGFVLSVCAGLLAAAPAPRPPLPELNEKVLAFARAKVGTSVGDGSCASLAIAALKEAGARFYPAGGPGGDFTWGEPVESFKQALPGDILQFQNVVLEGKKYLTRQRWIRWHHEYPHHTAIVSRVSADGKQVSVLHQNVTMQGQDEKDVQNVQETVLPLGSLQKGGSIRIYRPVPVPSPPPPRRDRPRREAPPDDEPEP